MAHVKVSVIRKWYGKVPLDRTGKPAPKDQWPKRRKFSWEVRWYSSEGKRYSKSFKERKEAIRHAKSIQEKVDKGKGDKPRKNQCNILKPSPIFDGAVDLKEESMSKLLNRYDAPG